MRFKILIIFLSLILLSCGSSYKSSYEERRGYMLLDTHELPRNRRLTSGKEIRNKRKTYKKFKKRNKRPRKYKKQYGK